MRWCGSETGVLRLAWKSPCALETGCAVLMLLMTSTVYAVQRARLTRLRKQNIDRTRLLQGMIGAEAVRAFFSAFMCLLHLIHLIFALSLAAEDYPHLLLHGACALSWTLVFQLNLASSDLHAVLDYRPIFATGSLVYTCMLYLYIFLYLQHTDKVGVRLKLLLWTSIMQFSATTLVTILEFRRHASNQAPDGYITLPDVEQADDGKSNRTWLKLFITACDYVWPHDFGLQVRVLLCVFFLVLQRIVNLAVPVVNQHMTDHFVDVFNRYHGGSTTNFLGVVLPWVVCYLVLMLIQGGMGGAVTGLLGNVRQFVWIPVGQDTFFRISRSAFQHVLDLDLDYHIKRKTGEVTKIVDRGTSAIQNILSTLAFSLGPQLIDVLIGSTYLASVVNPLIAVVVFVTIGSYMPLTIIVTEWRASIRREMNNTENRRSARLTDALLNYETIKYHNNEEYEVGAYVNEVKAYQKAEWNFTASLNLLNVVQSVVMFVGISAGLLVLASELGNGQISVGEVTLFLMMMAQLYAPLNFFGTYYRIIQQYFVDMENLFDLMDKRGAVMETPGAPALRLTMGEMEFDQVTFQYESGRQVVRDLSFTAPGGSTVAFVGATGSGKSTLTRLLFRFYDVTSGAIRIDGQNIKDITLGSLHTVIGLVPQDCVLFNDTIRHNIRYGRLSASDDELVAAADAACIHTTISSRFPKGYDTVVGERGLRLSGGEKQRVAFARALLKNAPILVLDEATSALDSITEKKIQASLKEFRQDRTLLIVAHRLSTIMDADLICVMKDGAIVEKGKHEELLEADGLYTQMWSKQQSQAADEPLLELTVGKSSSA